MKRYVDGEVIKQNRGNVSTRGALKDVLDKSR